MRGWEREGRLRFHLSRKHARWITEAHLARHVPGIAGQSCLGVGRLVGGRDQRVKVLAVGLRERVAPARRNSRDLEQLALPASGGVKILVDQFRRILLDGLHQVRGDRLRVATEIGELALQPQFGDLLLLEPCFYGLGPQRRRITAMAVIHGGELFLLIVGEAGALEKRGVGRGRSRCRHRPSHRLGKAGELFLGLGDRGVVHVDDAGGARRIQGLADAGRLDLRQHPLVGRQAHAQQRIQGLR